MNEYIEKRGIGDIKKLTDDYIICNLTAYWFCNDHKCYEWNDNLSKKDAIEIIREYRKKRYVYFTYTEKKNNFLCNKIEYDFDKEIEDKDLKNKLYLLLQELNDRQREVIHLLYWENESVSSISKKFNNREQTIYNLEQKALRRLRNPTYSKYITLFIDNDKIEEIKGQETYPYIDRIQISGYMK
jgi:hypothetical protein